MPAPNTIRQAQRLLTDERILEPRQGLGVYITADTPWRSATTVLAELKACPAALDRAISLIERAGEHDGR